VNTNNKIIFDSCYRLDLRRRWFCF